MLLSYLNPQLLIISLDIDLYSAFTIPPLTTACSPRKKVAYPAFSLLQERMNGNGSVKNRKIIIEPRLIVRESTGKVKYSESIPPMS